MTHPRTQDHDHNWEAVACWLPGHKVKHAAEQKIRKVGIALQKFEKPRAWSVERMQTWYVQHAPVAVFHFGSNDPDLVKTAEAYEPKG